MVLSLSELTGYLLDQQYVHRDAVVEGGFAMVDTSSRHSNVMVSADPAVGLFIKQDRSDPVQPASGWAGPGSTTHEASVYSLFGSLPRRRPGEISFLAPRYLGFDPDNGLLVLELLPDAMSLAAYHERTRRFPVT